jgi:uncharacterized cupin superfamily protein
MQEGAKWKRDRWAFNAFAFSRDGKLVARAATEWVDLMDVQTGKVVENLTTEFPDGWWDPTFSSDLKLLACKHQHDPSIIEMPWPAQTNPPGEAAEKESVATAEGQPKVQADDRPEADAKRESRGAMETVRTWTDRTGKFTVEAEFVNFVDGKVQLAKLNGRTTTFPIERLSTEDQQWIKDRITANE